jgi:hypothetical protein
MSDCTATRHGTSYSFRNYGCRCPAAVAANRRHKGVNRPPRCTGRRTGWSNSHDPAIDTVAVARACLGDTAIAVRLTPAERTVAVAKLRALGWSIRATAVRLGLSDRAVQRHRAKLAAAASGQVAA